MAITCACQLNLDGIPVAKAPLDQGSQAHDAGTADAGTADAATMAPPATDAELRSGSKHASCEQAVPRVVPDEPRIFRDPHGVTNDASWSLTRPLFTPLAASTTARRT